MIAEELEHHIVIATDIMKALLIDPNDFSAKQKALAFIEDHTEKQPTYTGYDIRDFKGGADDLPF